MKRIMRLLWLPGVLASALALASPPSSGPMATAGSACGQRALPLAVGNQWTYSLVPAPKPSEPIARIAPTPADTVVITVKSIDSAPGGDTMVTLEEKTTVNLPKDPKRPVVDELTIATSIRCSGTKFELSPDSFWFAGEPGGYRGLKLDAVERMKGTSLQLSNGRVGQAPWREDLRIRWTRMPYPGSEAPATSGNIELERQFSAQPAERVETPIGNYNAVKLGLVTTGRVTTAARASTAVQNAGANAASNTKAMELPADWLATLWIADGAGVVQTLNPFAHKYRLSAVTLK